MRRAIESTFETHDGHALFYRRWPVTGDARRGAIVLLHRGHEHSGRMAHLVDELDLPEFEFYAWDARGHGRSPGERGDAPSIGCAVRDVQAFIEHITSAHAIGIEDVAVVAQSVGAVLAAAWAHDYAPGIRAMTLASPAFDVKLYVPFARAGLRILHRIRGNFFVKSYVKAKLLTHDRERIASFEADPLIARAISVRMLLGLHDLSQRIVADAPAITVPTQLLISGDDWVVRAGPQHDFYERLGALVKERHVLDGFYHDTLGERDRRQALEKTRAFLLGRYAEPLSRPCLLDAHRSSFTRREADALQRPLPRLSARGLYWSTFRLGLGAAARISEGVRLGRTRGFDSGSMLDYIYRNEARGLGPLGRALDRGYLDAIGWRGIRRRKTHIKELLSCAARRLARDGAPLHVMDVAAGHGRYILEAVEESAVRPASVRLQDRCPLNVSLGRTLIEQKGLAELASFDVGDAFDRRALAAVEPRPTLIVVSGLYELFADNDAVLESLEGLAAAAPAGAYLIYTGQPWHPQLELIGRALSNHRNGGPWIMRRRTQAELDQLVARAGFSKLDQRIDAWGIFTVSMAQRQ